MFRLAGPPGEDITGAGRATLRDAQPPSKDRVRTTTPTAKASGSVTIKEASGSRNRRVRRTGFSAQEGHRQCIFTEDEKLHKTEQKGFDFDSFFCYHHR
jgi:hypothetical protein